MIIPIQYEHENAQTILNQINYARDQIIQSTIYQTKK